MTEKPNAKSSLAEKELNRLQEQFESFDEKVKDLTLDRMNQAPKKETEPQTKLSQQEIADSNDIYLKPTRTISCAEKFNEKYREDYNFAKEYVYFIAENHEIIGETINMWTKKFPGQPAEEWKIPTNKPVWAPRYVAEQIKNCTYHKMRMDERRQTGSHQFGIDYGEFVVDEVVNRLDARPATKQKSIFMGKNRFAA